MGARRRTRQGLSIHVESVLGKGISMQIETVAKEGFLPVRIIRRTPAPIYAPIFRSR